MGFITILTTIWDRHFGTVSFASNMQNQVYHSSIEIQSPSENGFMEPKYYLEVQDT